MQSRVLFGLAAATALFSACESSDVDSPTGSAGASGGGKGGTSNGGSPSGGKAGSTGAAGKGGASGGGAGKGGSETAGAGGVDDPSGDAGAGGTAEAGAGSGGQPSGGEGGEPSAEDAPAVAYVTHVQGLLHVAKLDVKDGAPTLLDGSPIDVEGSLNGVAVSPGGKFLFVAAAPSRIDTYPIAADGSLPDEPSFSAEVDDDEPLMAVTVDPLNRFAYGLSPFSKSIYVFKIDAESGELTAAGDPLLVGPAPDHRRPSFAAPDPTGKFVYVMQMAEGAPAEDQGIRGYRVNGDTGALTELADSPFEAGVDFGGAIVFRPDGKFLFSSGLALNAFAIAADTGKLTKVAGSPFSTDLGSDAWAPNITIDAQGKRLYTANFGASQHIRGFSIDATSGVLAELPGSPITSPAPYSLALGPSGRTLYVGNDTGKVSAYRVAKSGALTALDGSPFDFGGLEPDFAFVTLP